MNRRNARVLAMQYIFQMEAQKNFTADGLKEFLSDKSIENQKDYISDAIHAVCENLNKIDSLLEEYSLGWKVPRMAKPDLAILRLAAAEILFNGSVPKSVAINEAVELAKIYGDEKSPGFINAVLKNIG